MVVAIDMTVLLVLVLDELHHRRRHKHVAQMTGVVRLVVMRRQLLLRRIVVAGIVDAAEEAVDVVRTTMNQHFSGVVLDLVTDGTRHMDGL